MNVDLIEKKIEEIILKITEKENLNKKDFLIEQSIDEFDLIAIEIEIEDHFSCILNEKEQNASIESLTLSVLSFLNNKNKISN